MSYYIYIYWNCHIYNARKGLITAKKLVYPLERKEYDQKMKCAVEKNVTLYRYDSPR